MRRGRVLALVTVLALLLVLGISLVVGAKGGEQEALSVHSTASPLAGSGPIIIDHTCTDLSQVPDYWINQAQTTLDIFYGHTSHGSQPVSGMDFLAIPIPPLREYGDDLGHNGDTSWLTPTRSHLDANPQTNVVVWSWCGGASDNSEEGINAYLNAMGQLEAEYPGVTFVYMTGHLDGGGVDGNLNLRNNQIRSHCLANDKVLFDFADIESYNPDGAEFMSRLAKDTCYYDGNGDGYVDSANWAKEWCASHPGDPLCDWCTGCSCAHSEPLNCNLKGRAFWWMLARISGWSGLQAVEQSAKTASDTLVQQGDIVTYTVSLINLTVPLTANLQLVDDLPSGLDYVSGTLTATQGVVTDTAPRLAWKGSLSPTGAVTITYAALVAALGPETVTNTAVLSSSAVEILRVEETIDISHTWPSVQKPHKLASVRSAAYGDLVTYSLYVCNSTTYSQTLGQVTDTLPAGLAYVPGSLGATYGTVTETGAPTLTWSGVLSPMTAVTITYVAQVSVTDAQRIVNRAEFLWSVQGESGPGGPPPVLYEIEAALMANGIRIHLPVILKACD